MLHASNDGDHLIAVVSFGCGNLPEATVDKGGNGGIVLKKLRPKLKLQPYLK
jgi:hypothetical protein